MDVYVGATWQIRLNCPFVAAMRPMTNYFDHLSLLLRATLVAVAMCAPSRKPRPALSLGYCCTSTQVRFCFPYRCLWLSLFFFVCVWSISATAKRICAKFTGRTCLVPRSDKFECQGQRRKVKVNTDKNEKVRHFSGALLGMRGRRGPCVRRMFGKHL